MKVVCAFQVHTPFLALFSFLESCLSFANIEMLRAVAMVTTVKEVSERRMES